MMRSFCVVLGLAVLACVVSGCSGGGDGGNPAILSFIAANFSVNENGTPVTQITLTRSGNSAQQVSATVVLTDGTATGGPPPLAPPVDYDNTPILVTWLAGDTTDKVITVPILDDNVGEPDETLTMSLTSLSGGAALGAIPTAILTIEDNELAGTIQFSDASYTYFEDGTFVTQVTVQRVGGMDGDVSATIVSTDGTANSDPNSVVEPVDYTAINTVVTFLDQVTTDMVVIIPIVQDLLPELDETFTLSIVSTTGGATIGSPSTATVTIEDDDDMLQISNPSMEVNALFGWSVAKVGPSLAIGAPNSSPPAGVVRLFDPSVPMLLSTHDQPFAQQFGVALAPDGLDLIIGSSGNAWLYDYVTWTPNHFFTSALNGFGRSMISLGDGRIVIGAPLAQFGVGSSGAFLVYDNSFGSLHQTIEGKGVEMYGSDFARIGSDLLVGAPGGTGTVHRYSGNPLALSFVIDNPFPLETVAPPSFGEAVASMGTTVIVGAPDEDTFAPNDGRVYLFDGGPAVPIVPPGGIIPDGRFGAEIVVIGNRICVQEQNGGPMASGRVFVLDANGVLVQTINNPVPSPDGDFGASMCEFDGALVVGAPKNPFLLQTGMVFIFKLQ